MCACSAAPLVYENGWQIDAEGIRRAITPQTRAIVIVHPNNPTGHYTKPWEAEQLAQLCREFGLSLIVDEVFLDYGFGDYNPGAKAESFARGPGSRSSKAFRLRRQRAQQDCRAAADEGGVDCRSRSRARAGTCAARSHRRHVPLDECACAACASGWLEGREAIQDQIRRRVAANLAVLDQAVGAVEAVQRLAIEGGWYAVLRIPAIEPDEQTVMALLDRGVWVHPGYFFGMPESGWLVVSLLAPEAEFSNGVATLINYLGTNHGRNKNG